MGTKTCYSTISKVVNNVKGVIPHKSYGYTLDTICVNLFAPFTNTTEQEKELTLYATKMCDPPG
jgi:copper chaperone CopZ